MHLSCVNQSIGHRACQISIQETDYSGATYLTGWVTLLEDLPSYKREVILEERGWMMGKGIGMREEN